jgi:serine protease
VNPPSQSPKVNISAPFDGAKFRIGDTIHYEGNASDAEDGEIVGTLKWYDNGNLIAEGNAKTSFDLKIPSTASLGTHEIKLEATDAGLPSHTSSTSVNIQIKPKVCSSSQNCP